MRALGHQNIDEILGTIRDARKWREMFEQGPPLPTFDDVGKVLDMRADGTSTGWEGAGNWEGQQRIPRQILVDFIFWIEQRAIDELMSRGVTLPMEMQQ